MYVSCTRIRPRCRIHPQIHLGLRRSHTCARRCRARTRGSARTFTPHNCSHSSSQITTEPQTIRRCMLDICRLLPAPLPLAPQGSGLTPGIGSFRPRARWTRRRSQILRRCVRRLRGARLSSLAHRGQRQVASAGSRSPFRAFLGFLARGASFRKRRLLFCAVRRCTLDKHCADTKDRFVGFTESEESQHNC